MIRKITFLAVFAFSSSALFAQHGKTFTGVGTDTLLYQTFNFTNWTVISSPNMPPSVKNDTAWYTYDAAMLADGSGGTTARPGNWFQARPFYWGDTTNNVVMASNSWFNPAGTADDWLITPSIFISDASAKFSWKSAVAQTPRYGDGYEVRISTTTNDYSLAFKDTAFTAAEFLSFVSPNPDSAKYQYYNYSKGYVQGMNPADVACKAPAPAKCDSAYMVGILTTHTVSLAKYAGSSIYIAVHHNSHDDNLISVDDFLVTGTGAMGIFEHSHAMDVKVFPNPTTENINVSYDLPTSTSVLVNMYNVAGKLVKVRSLGIQAAGNQSFDMNVSDLPPGLYTIILQSALGRTAKNVVIK
jgi:hypothetical protein